MILFNKQIFPGEMISSDAFIPTSSASRFGATSVAVVAAYLAYDFNMTGAGYAGMITASLAAAWSFQRHYSRCARGGFFLDKPRIVRQAKAKVNFNVELTEHFQSLGNGFEDCVVTETNSLQYRVIKVPNTNPSKVAAQLDSIAIKTGIDEKEIIFQKVYGKRVSAFLVPLPKDQWENVNFNPKVLQEGKLLEHVANDIKGQPVVADRQVEPMCLIFGSTNSGKTEQVRTSIHCLMQSSLNPHLFIADPKPDMQDLAGLCGGYTPEPEAKTAQDDEVGVENLTDEEREAIIKGYIPKDKQKCLHLMKAIYKEGKKRQAKYNAAGCKNFWEYLKIDPSERPMTFYADELPIFLAKDLDEKLKKGAIPFHVQAESVLRKILMELRSAGVFFTGSLQTPKAEIINTSLRDQFGDRRAFNVPDKNASRVGLDFNGAEQLQKFGGMLYYSSMRLSPLLCRSVLI